MSEEKKASKMTQGHYNQSRPIQKAFWQKNNPPAARIADLR
jgi:hypothetical protein